MTTTFAQIITNNFDGDGKFVGTHQSAKEYADYVNEMAEDVIDLAEEEMPYAALSVMGKSLWPDAILSGKHFGVHYAMHTISLTVGIFRNDKISFRAPTVDWQECLDHGDWDTLEKEGDALLNEASIDPKHAGYLIGGAVMMMCQATMLLDIRHGGTKKETVALVKAAACVFAGETNNHEEE